MCFHLSGNLPLMLGTTDQQARPQCVGLSLGPEFCAFVVKIRCVPHSSPPPMLEPAGATHFPHGAPLRPWTAPRPAAHDS